MWGKGRVCNRIQLTQQHWASLSCILFTYRQKHFNWYKYFPLTSERPGPTKYSISSTRITSSPKSALTSAGRRFFLGSLNQRFIHPFLWTAVIMSLPVHCYPRSTEYKLNMAHNTLQVGPLSPFPSPVACSPVTVRRCGHVQGLAVQIFPILEPRTVSDTQLITAICKNNVLLPMPFNLKQLSSFPLFSPWFPQSRRIYCLPPFHN